MDDNRIITFIDDKEFKAYKDFSSNIKDSIQKSLLGSLVPIYLLASKKSRENIAKTSKSLMYKVKIENIKRAGVSPLPKKDTSKYNFTPGHPRENEVYAVHPINPGSYFPLSDFHHATFESKTCELISILMHLGATSISVQHKTGWGHDFAGSINVGMPGATGENANSAGASASGRASHASDVLFEAKFKGHEKPCLPEKMIWYEFEQTWKQMTEARMKFNSKEFQLSLDYSEDFGINAELVAEIEKVGGKVSGEFSNHKKTVWVVKGEFA